MMLASKANMFLGNGSQPVEQYWGLYFEAEEPDCVINMNKYAATNTVSLQTSRDGETWTDFDGNSNTGSTPVTLANIGDRVYFRSKSSGNGNPLGTANYKYRYFTISKKAGAHGNIMSLVNGETQLTTIPANYFFWALFDSCTNLTTPPELPATTLTTECYNNLFYGCTSLRTAPALPATSLSGCSAVYQYMFSGCTSLTTAPALPATILAQYCYQYMFENCTSLTTPPPSLPAQTADYAYAHMFDGCAALASAPTFSGTGVMGSHGCEYMFNNCTSLTTPPPSLPSTTINIYCYQYMFSGCTSLTTAPTLPATTLASFCYNSMFSGCVALTTAPALPATTLESYCYQRMFQSCLRLTTAPALPATTLYSYCYAYMFLYCSSLTTAPQTLPATTLASYCYQSMFNGCSKLTTAPIIKATNISFTNSMTSMFTNCSKLNSITVEFTSWGSSRTNNWVNGVASSGTFTCPTALGTPATISRGVNACPTNWNVYNPPAYWGLYFEAEEANCVVNMEMDKTGSSITNNPPSLEYSLDGSTWTTFDGSTSMPQGSGHSTGTTPITLANIGDRVYFRSTNTSTDGNMFYKYDTEYSMFRRYFTLSKKAGAHGNIMSLIWDNENAVTINLANQFYRFFEGCTNLTSAPSLPATTITSGCYQSMFNGCTSLTSVPQSLPATTVPTEAYRRMFYGCTSLTAAPNISATSIGVLACESMFYGCSALATAPQSLPATTLPESAYEKMFYYCASLVKAPNIGATTILTKAMRDMFDGCTSLNEIRVAFTTWQDAGVNLSNWVYNVAATGTFKCPSALGTNANITRGSNNCPTGWTVQNI